MKNRQTIVLGSFELVSGVLRISDPCYDKNTWCAGTVDNAAVGTWICSVVKENFGNDKHLSCKELIAVHSSVSNFKSQKFTRLKFEVGVDSGQAGIFDDEFYRVEYTEDHPKIGNAEYDHRMFAHDRRRSIEFNEELLKAAKLLKDKDKVAYHELRAKHLKEQENEKLDLRNVETTREWYEVCCDRTLSNAGAGVIHNGVVSSSGYGDGTYVASVVNNKDGQVVAVKIRF